MPKLESDLAALEADQTAPLFWNDQEAAQQKVAQANELRNKLHPFKKLVERVDDLDVLIEITAEEGDPDSLEDVRAEFNQIEVKLRDFEVRQLLSGPTDKANAFITVHAGAGGTEACDWAEMLVRMYQRWADQHGYKIDLVDVQGEEIGYRSATLQVTGEYAFGYLQTERGVHRLVRISPFDAAKKRHTSFASVDVVADIDEEINIEVRDEDLRVDTYRSGGKGGQNVNKVETAVRLTHLPSGVVVACQIERSQPKNRAKAMQMLKAKLYQIEEDKKRSEQERQYGEKGEIAWGSQIRSYVFQPYQMVKDHRTGHETGNISAVMDGDLDGFIEAKLRGQKKGDDQLPE